jgi:hypothetical protein
MMLIYLEKSSGRIGKNKKPNSIKSKVGLFKKVALGSSLDPIFFRQRGWDLNLRLHTYKAGLYCLSHASSPFSFWLFCRWGFMNYLPGLALNHDPPDLSLPSS